MKKEKKIISILGTRPQYIKLAPLSKQLAKIKEFEHIVINTGQHFDQEMSSDLFAILEMETPKYNLQINGGSHGNMTGRMLIELEKLLLVEKPDIVLIYGDCDTTLAGVLSAVKLGIKTAHVESGLRSYNRTMPEEINRIITDHTADLLFCPTEVSLENLVSEGISNNSYLTGNLQIDLLKKCVKKYQDVSILARNNLQPNNFILLTIHRHYNTDKQSLTTIFSQLKKIPKIIFLPIHPRTKKIILESEIEIPENIIIHPPANYLEMTILERNCCCIITDSGGVQVEAYFLKKRCFTVRPETEWLETLKDGLNELVRLEDIFKQVNLFLNQGENIIIERGQTLNCSKEITKILKNKLCVCFDI